MALPGGPLEICFSFDTTLSMTSYVNQVKARLQDMVQKLKSDVPGIKMSLFAHGDYFQKLYNNNNPYVTKYVDFTDDVAELCTFIKDAVPTAGGDWDECYELVMKEAREQLTWTPGTNRVLVMIGDARPHQPNHYGTKFDGEKIDWTDEVKKLLESNIRCYGVYCKTGWSRTKDKDFFQSLSELGGGSFLELEKFDSVFDFMMAICYREQGEDALFAYEAEVKRRAGGAAKDVHHMFTTLKKSVSNASTEGLKKAASIHKTRTASKTPAAPRGKRNTGFNGKKMPIGAKKQTKTVSKQKGKHTVQTRAGETGPAQRTRQKTAFLKSLEKSKKHAAGQKCDLNKLSQCKPIAVKRLRREKVPETNFALRYFPWSSWKVVISKNAKGGLVRKFENQNGKKKTAEYAAQTIFDGKTKCPALYEFAVRVPGCTKKVVYVKSSPGFASCFWRTALFPSSSLRKQVDNIIRNQAGDILVRRLVLKKFKKYTEVPSIVKNYDYVWVPEEGEEKYRQLKYDPYVISEEMEVD